MFRWGAGSRSGRRSGSTAGIEHRLLRIRDIESDAVGEREHGVGADDDAEGAGEPVDSSSGSLPDVFTTRAMPTVAAALAHRCPLERRRFGEAEPLLDAALARRRYGAWSSSMRNPTVRIERLSRTIGSSPLASMAASASASHGWNETAACRGLEPQVVGGREVPVCGGYGNQRPLGRFSHRRGASLADQLGRRLQQGRTRPSFLIAPPPTFVRDSS